MWSGYEMLFQAFDGPSTSFMLKEDAWLNNWASLPGQHGSPTQRNVEPGVFHSGARTNASLLVSSSTTSTEQVRTGFVLAKRQSESRPQCDHLYGGFLLRLIGDCDAFGRGIIRRCESPSSLVRRRTLRRERQRSRHTGISLVAQASSQA